MVTLTTDSTRPGEWHEAGENVRALTGPGTLICDDCGYGISIDAIDALPECPACGGARFRRGSLFDQPTVDADVIELPASAPGWLLEARRQVERSVPHLAYEEEEKEGKPVLIPVGEGWMRIGRSANADLRLDDATVSRRHALVVCTPEGELRALDDRSLNGLFVNGKQVEWAPLSDGDELEIGRYRIYVIE